MNILAERFPTSVEINGKEYALNTDFRVGLKTILAWEDPELTAREKTLVMLRLLYKVIPPDTQKACELAVYFLNCGEEKDDGEAAESPVRRVYSFTKDAKYIYSAIRQTHGIDLETVKYLHWWKFCYLFLDLDPDCMFQQMLHLRQQKQRGKLTKEEQAIYYRLRDILDLPQEKDAQTRSAEEEFMEKLLGSGVKGGGTDGQRLD